MGAMGIARQTFPERSTRDFFFVLFRHKWFVLLFFLIVLTLTLLGTFLSAKIYQSDALLLIRLGRESATLDPTAATGQVTNIQQTHESQVRSEIEMLTSKSVAEQVVDTVGGERIVGDGVFKRLGLLSPGELLGLPPPDPAETKGAIVKRFAKMLNVELQKESNVIRISFEARNPEVAQEALKTLIARYLDLHVAVYRTPGSDEFFSTQTAQLRSQLKETEKQIQELKDTTGIVSLPEQRTILLNQIGQLQSELETAKAGLASTKAKADAKLKMFAGIPSTLLRQKILSPTANNPIDYLSQKTIDLQIRENELLGTMTPQHHDVAEVQEQRREAQAILKNVEGDRSKLLQLGVMEEEASVAETSSRVSALEADLAGRESKLRLLNETEVRMASLQRDLDQQNAAYRNYADKLEQARIDRALEMEKISNVSVIQPATISYKPVKPNTLLNLALGLFLGLFGSVGLAFIFESLDHSMKKPEDVEKHLQLPVLTWLPRVLNGARPLAMAPSSGDAGTAPVLMRHYESVANAIALSEERPSETQNGGGPLRTLAVVSCYSGEGASSVAADIARVLASNTDGRVLLVDVNTESPSLHRTFNHGKGPGLTDLLLSGGCDVTETCRQCTDRLDLVPVGNKQVNVGHVFASKGFTDLIEFWKKEYSHIIFDAGPIGEIPRDLRLLRLMDGIIWTIEAERTRYEAAQRAYSMLEKNQARVLGVVLNRRRFYIPKWLYRKL